MRPNRLHPLLNFVLFQGVWFANVMGAAAGRWWLGPLATAGFLALHLAMARTPGREAVFLLVASGFGLAVDSLLAGALGTYTFAAPSPALGIVPLWMVTLWTGFAMVFNNSLWWLRGRLLLGVAFGAVGGPLAYLAGHELGALPHLDQTPAGFTAMALAWAAAMAALLALQRRITPVAELRN